MRNETNKTVDSKEELENQLQMLWTLVVSGTISVCERNILSTAIQNDLANVNKGIAQNK